MCSTSQQRAFLKPFLPPPRAVLTPGPPRYFSYALDTRIKPRWTRVRQLGLQFSLRYMLACSDELFELRVQVALGNLPEGALPGKKGLAEMHEE